MGLKELRKERGLTQRQAAEIFSLYYRTYQNYENGTTSPDMATAAQFARYFNCTIGELFNLEEGCCALTEGEELLLNFYRGMDVEGQHMLLGLANDMAHSGNHSSST